MKIMYSFACNSIGITGYALYKHMNRNNNNNDILALMKDTSLIYIKSLSEETGYLCQM